MASCKVAVVTGGNKGIGFEIVRGLCEKFDGIVYLTARDVERGEAAVESLKKLGLYPKFHQLDICDQESLDEFQEYLRERYQGLDILINNAAIAFKNKATEPFAEQAEKTIFTNFTQLVATCNALFPLLKPHARVVNISSSEGHLHKIPGQELRNKFSNPKLSLEELIELVNSFVEAAKTGNHAANGWPNSTYVVSKVGVSALTFIQQRAFDKDDRDDIVVNAVHPGYVKTDMTSQQGFLSPEEGAEAPLYCALLPKNVTAPRGAYIWWDKQIVDWVNGPVPVRV